MADISPKELGEKVDLDFTLDEEHSQPTFTCHRCKCTSTVAGAFQKKRIRKSKSIEFECTTCTAYKTAKTTQKGRKLDYILFLAAVVIIGSFFFCT